MPMATLPSSLMLTLKKTNWIFCLLCVVKHSSIPSISLRMRHLQKANSTKTFNWHKIHLHLAYSWALAVFLSSLFWCFVSVLLRTGRRLSTAQGRREFAGFRPARMLECPECGESVPQHELVKHLIVDHDFDPVDAGQLTGKVMRRLWSEEE